MYMLYIDNILFPVAPQKIVTEIEAENKTYSLIDGSKVNLPVGKGLKKFSFELLLPMSEYPFCQYEAGFCDASYYIDKLEKMTEKNEAVDFDIYRTYGDDDIMYLTSERVLVEKVSFTEDAHLGHDMKASVILREHKETRVKIAQSKVNGYEAREVNYTPPEEYIIRKGDTLWMIAKRFYDDGNMYKHIASINGITSPYTIYAGQRIKIRE